MNSSPVSARVLILLFSLTTWGTASPLENMAREAAFLRDNRVRDSVTETDSGLQYEVLRKGTGEKPGRSDTVRVHYSGELMNGRIFDSSYKRGRPATFGVTKVIEGWTEALTLMREGAKWKLYIPSKLAYGARGQPPVIGPNELLIFEVELIEIVDSGS